VAGPLRIEIVTPTQEVLDEQVDEVVLPGVQGEIGVLPGHTPLLTALGTGVLRVTSEGRESVLAVSQGFAEILPDRVTVLATIAERPEAIDREAAQHELDETERLLANVEASTLSDLSDRHKVATTRLEVAQRAPG
jgi:F-type H+-transporting ATPase subunit epsilon